MNKIDDTVSLVGLFAKDLAVDVTEWVPDSSIGDYKRLGYKIKDGKFLWLFQTYKHSSFFEVINSRTIRIPSYRYEEWFSKIASVVAKYEAMTGKEITIKKVDGFYGMDCAY